MNNHRLDLLLQFYEEDPLEPFNAYALAMEYQNKDIVKALEYFDTFAGRASFVFTNLLPCCRPLCRITEKRRRGGIIPKGNATGFTSA